MKKRRKYCRSKEVRAGIRTSWPSKANQRADFVWGDDESAEVKPALRVHDEILFNDGQVEVQDHTS